MKNILVISALVLSSFSAQAKQRILNCDISNGVHQNVSIEENGGKLELLEVSNTGTMVSRVIDQKELDSGILELNAGKYGGTATLTQVDLKKWIYTYEVGSLKMTELAGCR